MQIYYDIETVKNDRADAYFANKEFQADKRLKNEEKIKEDIEKKRQAAKDKAGLHWITGRVACVCWSLLMKPKEVFNFTSLDEKVILSFFFNAINKTIGEPTLVGGLFVMIASQFDKQEIPPPRLPVVFPKLVLFEMVGQE